MLNGLYNLLLYLILSTTIQYIYTITKKTQPFLYFLDHFNKIVVVIKGIKTVSGFHKRTFFCARTTS